MDLAGHIFRDLSHMTFLQQPSNVNIPLQCQRHSRLKSFFDTLLIKEVGIAELL